MKNTYLQKHNFSGASKLMFLEISVFHSHMSQEVYKNPQTVERGYCTEIFLFVVLKVSNNSVLGLFGHLVSEINAPENFYFWR